MLNKQFIEPAKKINYEQGANITIYKGFINEKI